MAAVFAESDEKKAPEGDERISAERDLKKAAEPGVYRVTSNVQHSSFQLSTCGSLRELLPQTERLYHYIIIEIVVMCPLEEPDLIVHNTYSVYLCNWQTLFN